VLANILPGPGVDEIFTRTDVSSAKISQSVSDALGSTIALSDLAGTIQTQYTYEPFGRTAVTDTTNTNPFQYTGRENDGTGLYYYRARYFHPNLQRFISEDPIGFAGVTLICLLTHGTAPRIFVIRAVNLFLQP
jgi:RHS repeat-associated protein